MNKKQIYKEYYNWRINQKEYINLLNEIENDNKNI